MAEKAKDGYGLSMNDNATRGVSGLRKDQRDLYWIMVFSTCLGFGTLGGFLFSLDDIAHSVTFHFTWRTVAAFVVGNAAGWILWAGYRRRLKNLNPR
jgi:hypothetical protein